MEKISTLKRIQEETKVKYTFGIIIKIVDDEKPGMFLQHWFLDFVHDIGAEIDFDIYIYS